MLSAGVGLALQLLLYFYVAQKVEPTQLGHYFLIAALVFIPAGIMEYGFVSSLIHTENPDGADYRSVLDINLRVVAVCVVGGLLIAGLLQHYYAVEQYLSYYLYLLPILFLMAYSSVQSAGLKKNLQIKHFAIVELISTVVFFATTMFFLWWQSSVMALIIGQLSKAVITAVLLYCTTHYMSRTEEKPLEKRIKHWNYGKYIIGEKIFSTGLSHADIFLVNHFLGPQVLGVYELLKRILLRPLISSYTAIEQVTFPMLSNATNRQSYKAIFLGIIRTNYIFFLTLLGVVVAPLILSFLPDVYQNQVLVFKALIVLAVTMMILNPVDIVAYSLDETKKYYRWVMCYGLLQIVVMVISLQQSLMTYIVSMAVYNLLVYVLSYFVLAKGKSSIKFLDWLKPLIAFVFFVGILFATGFLKH